MVLSTHRNVAVANTGVTGSKNCSIQEERELMINPLQKGQSADCCVAMGQVPTRVDYGAASGRLRLRRM